MLLVSTDGVISSLTEIKKGQQIFQIAMLYVVRQLSANSAMKVWTLHAF